MRFKEISTTSQTITTDHRERPVSVLYIFRYTFVTGFCALGLQRLYKLVSQVGALHDAAVRFPPPKCHPETRKEVLQHLSDWIEADPLKKFWIRMILSHVFNFRTEASSYPAIPDPITLSTTLHSRDTYSPIQWLYGPAGVGKSAIAQTLCEKFDTLRGGEHLIASFFFSRSDPTRNNPRYLFITIAYCLATFSNDSRLRAAIDRAIKQNPTVLDASIDVQFQILVVKPLQSLSLWRRWRLPKVVIIDGLDECSGRHFQQLVLKTIVDGLVGHSSKGPMYNIPLRFIITSRPEPSIRDLFSQPEFYRISNRTMLDDSFTTSRDIALYIKDGLSHIAQSYQDETFSMPEPWPLPGVIDELVQRASGQFIYAATVLKYVGDEGSFPPKQLEVVLGLPLCDSKAFADLDVLYHQILIDNAIKQKDRVVQVLKIILLTQNMPNIKRLAQIFSLPEEDLSTLRGLHSVLGISSDFVKIYHKSFADFLQNEERSQDYYVGDIHKQFLEGCGDMGHWDKLVDNPDAIFKKIPSIAYNKDQLAVLETCLGLLVRVRGFIPMDLVQFCSGFPVKTIVLLLQGLKCVLTINNVYAKIRIHSFEEFLMDHRRSSEFFVQPNADFDYAQQWCVKILN